MEVILLERIGKLGQMGDVVRVKDGYARNFLLPRNKALRANADNKARFESMRAELEKQSLERKGEAGKIAAQVDGKSYTVIRQSSETGQLYGSVTTRDVASLVSGDGITISRAQIEMNAPIKTLGQFKVPLALHPDIDVSVTVIVARSEAEAERIARGEDVTVRASVAEDAEAEAQAARERAEALFDAEAEEAEAEATEATAEPEAEAKPAKGKKKKSEEA